MRALIQRVSTAAVLVDEVETGRIGPGLLVFLGIEREDTAERAESMTSRLLAYRVFPDAEGRMNRDVREVGGGLLLVSQFTLAADTSRGLRPSFSTAAVPEHARELYDLCLARLRSLHCPVAAGVFGAQMSVSLVNDGPVTFLLTT